MNWTDPLALVPLACQAVYTLSSLPRVHALWRAKRSDQHSAAYHAMVVLAHAAMAAWAWWYAGQPGLVAAYAVAIFTAAAPMALIVYYRDRPGGSRRRPPP